MSTTSDTPTTSSSRDGRIGLVLGAGGATGAAFHAGALLALQHDLGWDPHSADVIVGSSAGSIVGGLLRAGLTTDDLAAWGSSVEALFPGVANRKMLDDLSAARLHLAPASPLPHLASRAWWRAVQPHARRPLHTALLTLLPDGWIDAGRNIEPVGQLLGAWPGAPLWVVAVRQRDGRRVVFGGDDPDVVPGRAIAASCAIPGVFTPVVIDGDKYIDGGAHSPTNADVLLDADVDTALVLSPMSAQPAAIGWGADRLVRLACRRRLRAECAQLTRRGIDVHVIEPDQLTLRAMGLNALDRSNAPAVIRSSFLATGAHLVDRPELRRSLGDHRRRPRVSAS